jgi:uncharacterized membrane protein
MVRRKPLSWSEPSLTASALSIHRRKEYGVPSAPVRPRLVHPVVLQQQQQRFDNWQLRIADKITAFAGSMQFVYIHTGKGRP